MMVSVGLGIYIKFQNNYPVTDDADAEAEEVLNDLNRLVEGEDANMNLNDSQRQQDGDWNQHGEFINFSLSLKHNSPF
jgi:hypothetical protein